jgi:methyl-accepting chemotaxis protein
MNFTEGKTGTLNIRNRLFIGFLLLSIPILIVMMVTLTRVSGLQDFAQNLLLVELPVQNSSSQLDTELYETQLSLFNWLLTNDPQAKKQFTRGWQEIQVAQENMDILAAKWANNEYTKIWDELKPFYGSLKESQDKLLEASPNTPQFKSLIDASNEIFNHMIDILDGARGSSGVRQGGLADVESSVLVQSAQTILQDVTTLRIMAYGLIVITILLAVVVSIGTARKIVQPLENAILLAKKIAAGERNIDIKITSNDETGELLTALSKMQNAISDKEDKLKQSEEQSRELFENVVKTAKLFSLHSSKVAAGDLRERLDVSSNDSMTQLGKDLNTMTDNLTKITKQITEASHGVVSTLEQVSQTVKVQSAGATEQASSINEITAALAEIEKSSTQTMEKAKNLGDAAKRTREKGELGLDAVGQSIQGMKAVRDKVQIIAQTILDLSNQTQQIGEITEVVNALAQQSKLLALNASIEAAKAGEAGKGFAVVATEVKNLAEQSEQSTKQVQKILEAIRYATEKAVMATEEGTRGVDYGTKLVEQTGEIIGNLNEVINETTVASQQIEAAVRQEVIGIKQIAAGMGEINQVTSSYVDSAKQTIDAMNDLAVISKDLKVHVDTYKI